MLFMRRSVCMRFRHNDRDSLAIGHQADYRSNDRSIDHSLEHTSIHNSALLMFTANFAIIMPRDAAYCSIAHSNTLMILILDNVNENKLLGA